MADDRERLLAAAISRLKRTTARARSCAWPAGMFWCPSSVIPKRVPSIGRGAGVGGFPRGGELRLRAGIGCKTTMTLHVIAEAQKLAGQAAFIDAEHALDPVYARKLGVMWITCWCRSLITASRRWKSRKR